MFYGIHSLDFENNVLDFDLEIPKLRINATYNLKGNILLLPLVGNGNVNIVLKDIKTTVSTKISLQNLPEVTIRNFALFGKCEIVELKNVIIFRK